jgi:hypothetical protein
LAEKVKINLEDAMLPEKDLLAPLPVLPRTVIQLKIIPPFYETRRFINGI